MYSKFSYSKLVFRFLSESEGKERSFTEEVDVKEYYGTHKLIRDMRKKFIKKCRQKQLNLLKRLPKNELKYLLEAYPDLKKKYQKIKNLTQVLTGKFDNCVGSVLKSPKYNKLEEAENSRDYKEQEKLRKLYRGFIGGLRFQKDLFKSVFTGAPPGAEHLSLIKIPGAELHMVYKIGLFIQKTFKNLDKPIEPLVKEINKRMNMLREKAKRLDEKYKSLIENVIEPFSHEKGKYLMSKIKDDPKFMENIDKIKKPDWKFIAKTDIHSFILKEKKRLNSLVKLLAEGAGKKLNKYKIEYRILYARYFKRVKDKRKALDRLNGRIKSNFKKMIANYAPNSKNIWDDLLKPNYFQIPLLKEAIKVLKKELVIVEDTNVVYLRK